SPPRLGTVARQQELSAGPSSHWRDLGNVPQPFHPLAPIAGEVRAAGLVDASPLQRVLRRGLRLLSAHAGLLRRLALRPLLPSLVGHAHRSLSFRLKPGLSVRETPRSSSVGRASAPLCRLARRASCEHSCRSSRRRGSAT